MIDYTSNEYKEALVLHKRMSKLSQDTVSHIIDYMIELLVIQDQLKTLIKDRRSVERDGDSSTDRSKFDDVLDLTPFNPSS